MRLTLDAAHPVDVVVADDGSTVSGVAVPWDELGNTSAGPVRFVRGSVRSPGADGYPVPFCLDHDTTRPVGVVAELVDDEVGLRFTAALDPVPAAEHARAQMKSRSRSGVSVSVDVDEYELDDDGTLVVHSSDLVELSSVVRPAFATARVAAREKEAPMTTTPADVVEAASSKNKADTPDDNPPAEPVAQTPARVPSHMPRKPGGSSPVSATVHGLASRVVAAVRAASGDADARSVRSVIEQEDDRAVRAALSDLTTSDWAVPGTFVTEVDNYIRLGMPEVEAFQTSPRDSWPVYQLVLDTEPEPGQQTAEKSEIPSTGGAASFVTIDGTTWSWGKDVSLQLIEDGGEQVVEQVVEVAADKVARLIAAQFTTAVEAAAQAGGSSITLDSIGAAIGLVAATGLVPDRILAAPDTYGKLWTLMQTDGPGLSSLSGVDETPRVVLAQGLTPGSAVVGSSQAVRTHMSRLARLRAVEVGLLGVNIGVYRRSAVRIRKAAALVKITSA